MKKILLIACIACGFAAKAQVEVSTAAITDTIFLDSDDTLYTQNMYSKVLTDFSASETNASRFDQKALSIQSDGNGNARAYWEMTNSSADTLWFSFSLFSGSTTPTFITIGVGSPVQLLYNGKPATSSGNYTYINTFYIEPNSSKQLYYNAKSTTNAYVLGHIALTRIDRPNSPVTEITDSDVGTTVELSLKTHGDLATSTWNQNVDYSGKFVPSRAYSGAVGNLMNFNISLPSITSNDANVHLASADDVDTLSYSVAVVAQNNSTAVNFSVDVLIDGELLETIVITANNMTGLYDYYGTKVVKFPEYSSQLVQLRSKGDGHRVEGVKLVIASEVITDIDEVTSASANNIKIYPNPIAEGQAIKLDLLQDVQEKITTINIIDNTGNMVNSLSSVEELSTTTLSKGMYILTFFTDEGLLTTEKIAVN